MGEAVEGAEEEGAVAEDLWVQHLISTYEERRVSSSEDSDDGDCSLKRSANLGAIAGEDLPCYGSFAGAVDKIWLELHLDAAQTDISRCTINKSHSLH